MICMISQGYGHVKLEEDFDVESETAKFTVVEAVSPTYKRTEYTDFAEAARAFKKAAKKLEEKEVS